MAKPSKISVCSGKSKVKHRHGSTAVQHRQTRFEGKKGGLGSCTRHGSKTGSQNGDELTNSYGGAKVHNSGRENKG
jgi:hypothetical protein